MREFHELEPGLRLFLRGIPLELLYQVDADDRRQVWLCRPLFVDEPDRIEIFRPGVRYPLLHSRQP